MDPSQIFKNIWDFLTAIKYEKIDRNVTKLFQNKQ